MNDLFSSLLEVPLCQPCKRSILSDDDAKVESDYPIDKNKKSDSESDKQNHRESPINTGENNFEKKISVRLRFSQSDGYNRIYLIFTPDLHIVLATRNSFSFCRSPYILLTTRYQCQRL